MIGIIALMALVMPQVAARFTGQHQFINGTSVKCQTCHPTIYSEILASNVHRTHGFGKYPCRGCHIPSYADDGNFSPSSPYYNPYDGGTGKYHAAALVECTFCHFNNPTCTICHNQANVTQEFEDSKTEAHRALYYRAENASGKDKTDFLKGTNEACIACHTHGANVTVIEPTQYLNITANADTNCTGWLPDGSITGVTPDCYNDGNGFNWSITMGINK